MNQSLKSISQVTPLGRSAISVLVLNAADPAADIDGFFHVVAGLPIHKRELNQIVFGHWQHTLKAHDNPAMPGQSESGIEDVVVVRIETTRLEIHCHGGGVAAMQIVDALRSIGYEEIDWSLEVAQSASSYLVAEAEQVLARATTQRAAAHLLAQVNGALANCLKQIERGMHNWSSAPSDQIAERQATLDTCRQLLVSSQAASRLFTPTRIVICGDANVGKSSLINKMVGYGRAVVFDLPGTTRDVVSGRSRHCRVPC